MRAINAQFEFFEAASVPGDRTTGGMRQGSASAGRVLAQKYKNSGNEAKKWLKTKDVTFLNAANYSRCTYKFAQIRGCKEQKTARFAQTKRDLGMEVRGQNWYKRSAT